jgi:xanthine dehydrogenase YagR molybdenum-binding subunit
VSGGHPRTGVSPPTVFLHLTNGGESNAITWRNAPRLHLFESNPKNRLGQTYLVLQDDQVRYSSQHPVIVVAETGEQAQYAASLLVIRYSAEPSNTDLSKALDRLYGPETQTRSVGSLRNVRHVRVTWLPHCSQLVDSIQ